MYYVPDGKPRFALAQPARLYDLLVYRDARGLPKRARIMLRTGWHSPAPFNARKFLCFKTNGNVGWVNATTLDRYKGDGVACV